MTAGSLTALSAVDDAGVSPGVLGFVVVALLGVATFLLIRSMNRQIKRIDIPADGTPTRDAADEARSDDAGGGTGEGETRTDPGEVPPTGSAQG